VIEHRLGPATEVMLDMAGVREASRRQAGVAIR
jgi:hypothetical protein